MCNIIEQWKMKEGSKTFKSRYIAHAYMSILKKTVIIFIAITCK